MEWGSRRPPLFYSGSFRARGPREANVSSREPGVEPELEERIQRLGFELVDVQWAGSKHRPIVRIRIDRPDSEPGRGVSVGDCEVVSRALESWLEASGAVPERYVLEVSSPGVDRPLRGRRDWERFTGKEVAVKGREVLAGRATRLEGTLLGLEESGDDARVHLELADGTQVRIPLSEISGAHLLFRWK